ncbi:hypothetical protein D918_02606 [Trichuris suis]|nr:hypothetical protein D918_02606 [Trichuris suis]
MGLLITTNECCYLDSLSVNTRQILEGLNQNTDSSLDILIAPGFRLWMLLALVLLILLVMTVVVCCFIKLRIPRTKREIELNAVRRKLRRRRLLDTKEAHQLSAVLGNQVDHTGSDQSATNTTSAECTDKISAAT